MTPLFSTLSVRDITASPGHQLGRTPDPLIHCQYYQINFFALDVFGNLQDDWLTQSNSQEEDQFVPEGVGCKFFSRFLKNDKQNDK